MKKKYVSLFILLITSLFFSSCVSKRSELEGIFVPTAESRVELNSPMPVALKGGVDYTIVFHVESENKNIREIRIELSKEGKDFTAIATLPADATEFKWRTPAEDVQTARLRVTAADAAGRIFTRISGVFRILSTPPRLVSLQNGSEPLTNQNEYTFSGSCTDTYPIEVRHARPGQDYELVDTVICADKAWSYTLPLNSDGRHQALFTHIDIVGNSSSITLSVLKDSVAPVVAESSLVLNNGESPALNNYIPVSFDATDSVSDIVSLCVKDAVGTTPEADSDCFVKVDAPDQRVATPGKSIHVSDFYHRIGFTRGTYRVAVWVMDLAGNISSTVARDLDLTPSEPPSLTGVIVDKVAPKGTLITLKWNIQTQVGLAANPLTLSIRTNTKDYEVFATDLQDGANGGCTVETGFTGCYRFASPYSSYFRLRLTAKDRIGMISYGISGLVNAGPLESIAGNPDLGLNATGTAAVFANHEYATSYSDTNTLVVQNNGVIYFRDPVRGVLRVDPKTGIQSVFLATGKDVVRPLKIALDFSNGLLVWDNTSIKRVDTVTGEITSLIGGGESVDDGVPASQVKITPLGFNISSYQAPFIPMPNGDLIFQPDQWYAQAARFRVYHASSKTVTSIYPHGIGSHFSATEDIATCTTQVAGKTFICPIRNLTVGFDPITSIWKNLIVDVGHSRSGNTDYYPAHLSTASENLGESQGPHAEYVTAISLYHRMVGRNGATYSFSRARGVLSKFNEETRAWEILLGTGRVGDCKDNTNAKKCSVELHDVFVNGAGHVYFVSRGRIRTIDPNGNVQTVTGQASHFGEDKPAVSARFNELATLDVGTDGYVYVLDRREGYFNRFKLDGNLELLAGNGEYGNPLTTELAVSQPLPVSASGGYFDMFRIDPATNDIIFQRGYSRLARLNFDAKKWADIKSIPNTTGDLAYQPSIIGIGDSRMLVATSEFDYDLASYSNARHRLFKLSDGAEQPFMGVAGATTGSAIYCDPNTPVENCVVPVSNPQAPAPASFATYDAAGTRWLLLQLKTNRIVAAGTGPGALTSNLVVLDRAAQSFAYRRNGSVEEIYYCDTSGRLNYRQVSQPHDVFVPWAVSAIKCNGTSLAFFGNSLVFPTLENGRSGVGRYVTP